MYKCGFIGLGKLGMPCAEVMHDAGHIITGYDIKNHSAVFKTVDSIEALASDQDIIFIAVQTPHAIEYSGSSPSSHLPARDFNYDSVKLVLTELNETIGNSLVVLISTVLPGTVRRELSKCIPNADLIYNPYLIAMSSVKADLCNPEMVIIGTDKGGLSQSAIDIIEFYHTICDVGFRYEIGTWEEAESIKIFYNTFISAKITLVNMIQDVSEALGHMDVDVVTNALASSTQRIMSPAYMKAGLGDAGPCVLGNFPLHINNESIRIDQLYNEFDYKENDYIVKSCNYSITLNDNKKIHNVTCREFTGELVVIETEEGDILEVTPNHLIPITRNGTRLLIQAEDIVITDKVYKL